jgi:hypothetical protein
VQRVPKEIESGNFIGEEFDHEESGAGADNGPAFQQLQSRGQGKMAEARQKSEDGDGGVKVQSGGKSDGDEKGEEFGRRDFQDVEHGRPRGLKPSLNQALTWP